MSLAKIIDNASFVHTVCHADGRRKLTFVPLNSFIRVEHFWLYTRYEYCGGAPCWCRSRLRHCATSQKVAASIPDGVTGIFY